MDQNTFHSFGRELVKIAQTKSEKQLYGRVKKESPVKVKTTDDAKLFGGGYFDPEGYLDAKKERHIGISDHKFDTLAHEIGHAKNHETLWGKLIQSLPARLAFALAPTAGMAAGVALANGKKWPLLIPAAAVAPVLLAEALATNTGHKVLEKAKAKPEEVEKYRKNLRKAFSTYLLTPAATAAVGTFSYMIQRATNNVASTILR